MLTLEGDEQVVTLGGSIDVGRLVTGLVVGVVGKQIDGVFSVEHVVFPAASPTTAPAPTSDARPDDSFVVQIVRTFFSQILDLRLWPLVHGRWQCGRADRRSITRRHDHGHDGHTGDGALCRTHRCRQFVQGTATL